MSAERQPEIERLAQEVVDLFNEILKEDRLDDVPDDSLGQLFASVVRLYAAKVEGGNLARAFARNSGITATDVMIGCTAMLQATNVKLFDLGHWQAMSTIGKHDPEDEFPPSEESPS
jgi:hypothetical protein